ncbi:NADH-quinone oxidoreductase subunit L [Oryzomonas sagensis]|uniref:NADH-quinone oxidoreductase subunit L n=1 Tax=Oryzomonas sagensis TaxID=2603857 RepID=A0ABQ6TTK4_9BACT|nr:NADH-ubiquinone oxidoreductase-F iron-sulfur binding region domain-containing protein [Oryzomonas sagensis]KAB0672250.1 NADH-quinone oxidoreductase subunit L [Oryzomonas sagensis]
MKTPGPKDKGATARGGGLKISVCLGSPCLASGAAGVLRALRETWGEAPIAVIGTGCMGPCSRGPMIRIERDGHPAAYYERMTPQAACTTVAAHLAGAPPGQGRLAPDFPFIARQTRIVLEQCGRIDPNDLNSARAAGGYRALAHAIGKMTPEQVCGEIGASGLRGRGGGGYPTGTKWELVRAASGRRKYVVANGDEGDPGAFMDRTLMESDPHRLLEGMVIAGYAVGARDGFIFVRGEYPLAAQRLGAAIADAGKAGLLGRNILGSGFSFRIRLRIGAGAFVCGEETALMASVMGRRGQPVIRPPYPAQRGLWGGSTLINNVETFGCIAPIIRNGAAWFRAMGTPGNSGTKVFSISGDVATEGVLEVPLGTPLRELLAMAGGVSGGSFKAAQTGGASGGCIPAGHMDVPVDYESLKGLGTIMGSGGLIVMNDQRCMTDVARFFMHFCQDESCGKCAPCRTGTQQAARLLDRIAAGEATSDDMSQLEQLCRFMQETSLCGLGMAAPTPVLSTLRWFREEYESHVRDRRCPTGVCAMEGVPCRD